MVKLNAMLVQFMEWNFEEKREKGFDSLFIAEANREPFIPVLALLSHSKERVEAEQSEWCPFGHIGQNRRQHRRLGSRVALVLHDDCDAVWMFACNGNFSSFGIDGILHKPFFTVSQLNSFDYCFFQPFLRYVFYHHSPNLFLLCIFCQYLFQKGEKRQLCSLLLNLLKYDRRS